MSTLPTGFETYSELPYHFPLIDPQPVVRIPIAGPAPFNTLAVVRGRIGVGKTEHGMGKLDHYVGEVGTGLKLIGFDPRQSPRPPATHSTTLVLHMLQTKGESAFVCAVDTVEGKWTDDGAWVLTIVVGSLWGNVYAAQSAYFSSWVLCYEPPPVSPFRYEDISTPPLQQTDEAPQESNEFLSPPDSRFRWLERTGRRRGTSEY